jgi:hypothetical protein
MSTPLHTVKEQFGSKEALVGQLMPLLDKEEGESESEFKERLLRVSNRMLLRLWNRQQSLTSTYGNREGLIDAIVSTDSKNEASLRAKLGGYSTGRLLNLASGSK